MKKFGIAGVWVVIILVGAVFGVVSIFPYPTAPFGLQQWAPLPVACAGYSCVTYREWTQAINRDSGGKKPAVILSALVLDKATQIVAYYEKVRISNADIKQAGNAVEKTINAIPGGKNMLNQAYGGNAAVYLSEKGIGAILLREKLSAIGVTNPWQSKYAPTVTVWNVGLKWDAVSKSIVTR